MATTTSTVSAARPASVTVAAVTLVLSAVIDFVHVAAYLSGAAIPPVVSAMFAALGVASLAAAGGIWAQRRWAVPLALVEASLAVMLGTTGFFTGGSPTGEAMGGISALLGLAVLALVAARGARRAAA
jgi:uncharacterized membrane protein (DUF2068 family)